MLRNWIATIATLTVLWTGCAGVPDEANEQDITAEKGVSMSTVVELTPPAPISLSKAQGVRPGVEEFYNDMGIELPPGKKEQFIVGDNISGYFEGYTHIFRKGLGYMMKNKVLLEGHASFKAGLLLNRSSEAMSDTVLPYGHLAQYPGASEELMVHSGKNAVSLKVTSDVPVELAAMGLWEIRPDDYDVEVLDQAVLLSPKVGPSGIIPDFIAVTANQSFRMDLGDKTYSGLDALGLNPSDLKLIIASEAPTTSLTVHIAFGFTKEDAINKSKSLISVDIWNQELQDVYNRLTTSHLWTSDKEYNKALVWAKASAWSFVVQEFGKGIWAGLPWFRDNWGRDTFIALPGTLLVSGLFQDAKEVLNNFARYQNLGAVSVKAQAVDEPQAGAIRTWLTQKFRGSKVIRAGLSLTIPLPFEYAQDENNRLTLKSEMTLAFPGAAISVDLVNDKDYGRVPNRVAAGDSIIYNTVDGTPWMIREALEYIMYTGDKDYAKVILPLIKEYVKGARQNYVDAEGLLTHDDADTWMDARISGKDPWSARGSRAVEIQALWYSALQVGGLLSRQEGQTSQALEYEKLAQQVKASFLTRFWDGSVMADRVRIDNSRDIKVRPNQLMLVSIPFSPFIPEDVEAQVTKSAVSTLLFPYGIASLDQNHPYFHPLHENTRYHHKDAAYHNGTIWGWNAGFTITALNKFGYQDLAWQVTKNLGDQILYMGTRGSMSENMNALPNEKDELKLTGTYAQSWSVAEFARNGYQDYLGFRPNLLNNTLTFEPALPTAWTTVQARLPYGKDEILEISLERSGPTWTWRFSPSVKNGRKVSINFLANDKSRKRVEFILTGSPQILSWNGVAASLDGKGLPAAPDQESYETIIGDLKLATPRRYDPLTFPMLEGKNVLQDIIKSKKFE